jgi:preprotein translocase subunit SecB
MENNIDNTQTDQGRVAVRGQYVLDMSFENTKAP